MNQQMKYKKMLAELTLSNFKYEGARINAALEVIQNEWEFDEEFVDYCNDFITKWMEDDDIVV